MFGPGRGESIAIHLGEGDWMTVDSCRDQVTRRHPVLDYFDREGIDVSTQVKLVVATHAHDDHVAGISGLYGAAKAASFVASAAVDSTEFFAQLEVDADIERLLRQKVRREYRTVMDEVELRADAMSLAPLEFADEGKVLYARYGTGGALEARVTALSPSSAAVLRARKALARGLAKEGQRPKLAATDPNEMSIALWVEWGSTHAALLGADLLTGPARCGWQAVLASHAPNQKAQVFKVPHHGSPTAHHDGVWADLLTGDVVSVVAPFRGGSVRLPSDTDVARIVSLSGSAYITASARMPAAAAPVRRIQATLSPISTNVREPYGRVGQVRLRLASDGAWHAEHFSPASPLKVS